MNFVLMDFLEDYYEIILKQLQLFRYPLKAVKVMHTVALRTESSIERNVALPNRLTSHEVSAKFRKKFFLIAQIFSSRVWLHIF